MTSDNHEIENTIITYEDRAADPFTIPEYKEDCIRRAKWLRELLHLRSVVAFLRERNLCLYLGIESPSENSRNEPK